jgi:tetraacyldisaccharide 4'-kinase
VTVRRRFEDWLHRRWYRGTRVGWPLAAAERLYAGAIGAPRRPPGTPPCPVIVVGNLVAGGSGKTPVVAAIARHLAAQGRAVALIARGYRSRAGRGPARVRVDGTAREFGDEALELVASTGLPMWVGRDRAAALSAAVAAGAEVVISDDGLQHAALPRSFEICVVDARRGFGNGRLLPAGPLRQPLGRLENVDLVLIKRCDEPADDLPEGAWFALDAEPLRPLRGRAQPPKSGAVVDAVAGIADPTAFFERLQRLGLLLREHPLGDHAAIPRAWLAGLPGPVVMTAKDAARLGDPGRDDAFVLPVRAVLPAGVLQRIAAHVRKFPA